MPSGVALAPLKVRRTLPSASAAYQVIRCGALLRGLRGPAPRS